MPNVDWTSLATGGAAVGLISTWATTRRQRGEQLRDRMLDLADRFVATLRAAERCIFFAPSAAVDWQESSRLEHELWMLEARIELLYGPDSRVAEYATEAVIRLGEAAATIRRGAADEHLPSGLLDARTQAAESHLADATQTFVRGAGALIRSGGQHPVRSRVVRRVGDLWLFASRPERRRTLRELRDAKANYLSAVRDVEADYEE